MLKTFLAYKLYKLRKEKKRTLTSVNSHLT